MAVSYDAPAPSEGGRFNVTLGGKSLVGVVQAGTQRQATLGRVSLETGRFEIAVEPVEIRGAELMRLRALTLTPVAAP